MLELHNLETGYNKKQVLFDVSLHVDKGEIVSIIGPNGSGKSTIMKVIFGLIPVWNGKIIYNGSLLKNTNPIH